MRRRFGVFLWLLYNEQARDELVTRLRAHRGIQAAPQGDLVLVMSPVRARGAREACERFERDHSDDIPEDRAAVPGRGPVKDDRRPRAGRPGRGRAG